MSKENIKVTVLGGYGGMGRFFSKLFSSEGYSVTINGPDETTGKKTAKEIGAIFEKDAVKAVRDADIVMVSVPIKATLEVIKNIAPRMKDGALLMDVTSVKEKPCEYMKKYAPKKVEVIGTHPVFSHRVGSLEGQVFVLTPVRGRKWLAWLKDFLAGHKVRVYESTPEDHDKVMAVVQGLTHYAYISIGKTLDDLDFDIKESRKYSSPVYELMLDMVGRIIGQNPELYASIQMNNPQVPKIHKTFMKTAAKLSKAVKDKDTKAFVKLMREAAENFDDLDRAMGRSDKAIHSLISELDLLKNSVGKELCLRHIYSGTVHLGVVRSVSAENVVLDEYGKRSELKISNIEVLSDRERIMQRKQRFGAVLRDYSVVFEEGVEESFIKNLLLSYSEDIVSVEVKDVYRSQQLGLGRKSVCFRLELIDRRLEDTDKRVRLFFSALGGVFR